MQTTTKTTRSGNSARRRAMLAASGVRDWALWIREDVDEVAMRALEIEGHLAPPTSTDPEVARALASIHKAVESLGRTIAFMRLAADESRPQ